MSLKSIASHFSKVKNLNTKLVLTMLASALSLNAMANYQAEDSEGVKTLEAQPVRVAALNWDIAEQVIELGVTPVAVPDIAGYSDWVVQPAIPEGVADIGTRTEPNFSALKKLNPDVILIASPQKDLQERLSEIAPVLYYQTYSEQHSNAEAAIENFKKIGQLLGKEEQANKKLAAMDERLDVLKAALDKAYSGDKPKVTSFRFASTTSVYIYGDNSIPQYALEQLGFENAMDLPVSQWGISQKRMTELKNVKGGIALYFEPFPYQDKLDRSPVWKSMPFVRDGQFSPVAASWSYGGAMSILYNAEAMAQSLLTLAEQ
ncbi:Ferrichrome-binding periplasmic protein precursor (TC 3.A.1.14.3) [Vibrio chagasii]|nr:Ferrichrome-binding periplasmic protein precursor (TC 3.A.1.14.3) [Vibrio chagasii]CAH6835903.1 Ferrichrome-binding periplasmic protein precursor (TC 3.A.1.14.3) [Vibrio chagasii]CAH6860515.1 Ferrichrome-binding periplasmic protein precursor (TC 3.A.1.14.3) [Vibrio chagasii]CAH7018331.1 Ferrichrome-binding periplasmic protein precursor (TC 3.A.1.14.3) [Vibrio chagasii]CAH7124316.1 Ferrichrome-binding periplasmic protein precursor (TC 3.A.1.14.3) [Vibrio chagasii]